MHIVDLFSGCGGFSQGAAEAGLKPALAFDIDPILTSSYERNHIGTRLVRADLSRVSGNDIRRELGGSVDGVFGGPPCQGFSDIGHRHPNDPRRLLLGHFFRLIDELSPAFFIMENVKGLAYSDARPVLDVALERVAGRYDILGPLILDAADFGAATRRPRLFVIGFDQSRMDAITIGDIRSAQHAPATVREAIGDLSSAIEVGNEEGFDLWRVAEDATMSAYASGRRSADSSFTGHRKTIHTEKVISRFAAVPQGGKDDVGRHPRLSWDGQCPTLRAGTGSDHGSFQSVRPIHPAEARVITVREAARLQGFPDDFRFHPTVWHSFRMIGNSVSPIIAKALFELIARRIDLTERMAAE
jgi:DNA (cytosine-5)-methyltransferase 1